MFIQGLYIVLGKFNTHPFAGGTLRINGLMEKLRRNQYNGTGFQGIGVVVYSKITLSPKEKKQFVPGVGMQGAHRIAFRIAFGIAFAAALSGNFKAGNREHGKRLSVKNDENDEKKQLFFAICTELYYTPKKSVIKRKNIEK